MAEETTDLLKEAYTQNYEQFRALNQIMWQIPVLAMTLTGGLWFGVSQIEQNKLLVTVLLLTAVAGNLALSMVLVRFRHVMECYIEWLRNTGEQHFVKVSDGKGKNAIGKFCTKNMRVRSLFLFMLLWSAIFSAIILTGYWMSESKTVPNNDKIASVDYYDQYATSLADGYEAISFEAAYPFLSDVLKGDTFSILDIGSGSGRDAAWLAEQGHTVFAVEPSNVMRKLAKNIHSNNNITWLNDSMPKLSSAALKEKTFDFILINAVWMHLRPTEYNSALERVYELLSPAGEVYVSLRIGPSDEKRYMFEVSPVDFVVQAEMVGFKVIPQGDFNDLLERPEVSWKVFKLTK